MSNSNGISGYLSIVGIGGVGIGGTLLPCMSAVKHLCPSNQILRCAQDDTSTCHVVRPFLGPSNQILSAAKDDTPARYDRIAKKKKEGNCLK